MAWELAMRVSTGTRQRRYWYEPWCLVWVVQIGAKGFGGGYDTESSVVASMAMFSSVSVTCAVYVAQ